MDERTFFDSGYFGCLLWGFFAAAFYGVSRLLWPLIELLPASAAARAMLLIIWTFFFVVSGWCIFLGCVVGEAKARSALLWVFYGCLETIGASITLVAVYALIGYSVPKGLIPRDWQLVLGFLILLAYGLLVVSPTFQWLLDKHAPKQ